MTVVPFTAFPLPCSICSKERNEPLLRYCVLRNKSASIDDVRLVIVVDENCTIFMFEVMDYPTLFLFFLVSFSINKNLDPVIGT